MIGFLISCVLNIAYPPCLLMNSIKSTNVPSGVVTRNLEPFVKFSVVVGSFSIILEKILSLWHSNML